MSWFSRKPKVSAFGVGEYLLELIRQDELSKHGSVQLGEYFDDEGDLAIAENDLFCLRVVAVMSGIEASLGESPHKDVVSESFFDAIHRSLEDDPAGDVLYGSILDRISDYARVLQAPEHDSISMKVGKEFSRYNGNGSSVGLMLFGAAKYVSMVAATNKVLESIKIE